MRTKKCAVCGMEFATNSANKKYCSEACKYQAAKKAEIKTRKKYKRTCPTCGQKFVTTNSLKKYCCKECQEKAGRKYPNQIIKICPVCGREFAANHISKKYCSPACKAQAKRETTAQKKNEQKRALEKSASKTKQKFTSRADPFRPLSKETAYLTKMWHDNLGNSPELWGEI